MKTQVVLSYLPIRHIAYHDWLVTGLGLLELESRIGLSVVGYPWENWIRNYPLAFRIAKRALPRFLDQWSPIDYWCVVGRVVQGDRSVSFAIDYADSPFNYALGLLETVDVYFKCQCPKQIEQEGFPLTRGVRIPYHPDVFALRDKIRPGMLGRPLGRTLNLKRNLGVLKAWESSPRPVRGIRIFACFGSDRGPSPRSAASPLPAPHNYQSEGTLLARWGNRVQHPNEKRGKVVGLLRSLGRPDLDARICRTNNPEVGGPFLSEDQYRDCLGNTAVNVNISGYRRSLPFRIMDTLMTGGMVATDALAVRWYKDFGVGCELMEIGELGYEPEHLVDWDKVRDALLGVYERSVECKDNPAQVRAAYQQKWAPRPFAEYVVKTCTDLIAS